VDQAREAEPIPCEFAQASRVGETLLGDLTSGRCVGRFRVVRRRIRFRIGNRFPCAVIEQSPCHDNSMHGVDGVWT